MADEVLKVVGSADMSSLKKGLTEAQRELSKTANEALSAERKLQTFSKGSATASNALLNLGNIAQNAPNGIIAISESILPAVSNFKQLKTETGSTGNALKSLGSSLASPTGLLAGFSLLGTALIAIGKEVYEYITRLSVAEIAQNNLNKSFADAEASVAGNVSRLKALVSIAQDVNNSDAKRKEAIGALNKEYDVFNKQLSLSNINTGFATDLIDKQTQALIRQAKIRGVENLISKTTEKRYEVINSKLSDNLTLWDNVKAAAIGGLSQQGSATFQVTKGLDRQKEALQKNTEETAFYEAELRKLLDTDAAAGTLFKETEKKVKSLSTTVKAAAKDLSIPFKKISFKPQGGEFDIDFGGVPFEEALAAKLARESINKGTLVFPIPVQPKLEFIQGLPTTLNELDQLEKIAYLKSVGVATGIQDGLKVGVNGLRFPNLTALYESTKEKIDAFSNLVNQSVNSLASGSLASLGETIGNVLSGKESGLDGLFNSIFTSVGDQIQQLGKFLIQSGVQISIAKKAFEKLLANPLASIAVGVGLVALGALIKNAVGKKPQGFATGTRNFTGGTALVGERGPELLTIPSGASVTPNAQSNAILNGAANGGFVASYVLRGQDLVTVINRTTQSNNRLGF